MIGHVYITGQIGNEYDEQGNVTQKGVELIDVVSQVESLGEGVEQINVHINSPGGYVSVGNSIAEFLSALKNCFTIAEETCASIATKIHLAVPLQNRMVQEGCAYVIHNPFLAGVTGDAAALQEMADSTKAIEEELESMYSKATGVNKAAISGLMNIETGLTASQCLEFKFASSIVNKEQARPLALIYTKMSKTQLSFKQRTQNAIAMMKGETLPHPVENSKDRVAKAVILETDKGPIETPFADIAVGDAVFSEGGEPVEDQTYNVTTEGVAVMGAEGPSEGNLTVVVKDGLIESITPATTEPVEVEDSIEELKSALEAEREKNSTLEAENSTLKAEAETAKNEVAQAKLDAEEAVKQLEGLANIGSDFTVPEAVAHFRREKKNEPQSMKDRRASYAK